MPDVLELKDFLVNPTHGRSGLRRLPKSPYNSRVRSFHHRVPIESFPSREAGCRARVDRVDRHQHARCGSAPSRPLEARRPRGELQVGTTRRTVPRVQAAVRRYHATPPRSLPPIGRCFPRETELLSGGPDAVRTGCRAGRGRRAVGGRRGGGAASDLGRPRGRQDRRRRQQGNAGHGRAAGHGPRGTPRRPRMLPVDSEHRAIFQAMHGHAGQRTSTASC